VADDKLDELLDNFKKHLELNRGFGVEFVRRAPPKQEPPPPAAPRRQDAAPPSKQPRRPPAGPRRPPSQRRGYNTEAQLSPEIPPRPVIPPNDIFEELRNEVANCEKCELCKTRTHVVFGEGDPTTDLVFVGEGPGADEDRSGRPFVGRAGVLLTRIIQDGMKLPRHRVFIGNVVKCRPPGNRAPTLSEMVVCRPYLMEQLRTIRPKVIVALGATAVHGLLGEKLAITKERGKFRQWEGVKVMPTFHPAYLLRNYTRDARRAVWDDMKAVMKYLGEQKSPLAGGWRTNGEETQ